MPSDLIIRWRAVLLNQYRPADIVVRISPGPNEDGRVGVMLATISESIDPGGPIWTVLAVRIHYPECILHPFQVARRTPYRETWS